MTAKMRMPLVLLALLGLGGMVLAEIPDPPDPSESAIDLGQSQGRWVEQVQAATNLMVAGKPTEALDLLQGLQRDLPGLDTDGLVAVAIGDCHLQLKQYEQAYTAYQQAAQLHPALNDTIWARLADAESAMGKHEAAAARLHATMTTTASTEGKAWAAERMAALQERQAIQALQQAEEAYRKASTMFEKIGGPGGGGGGWTSIHADDLKDAIAQLRAALSQRQDWNEFLPLSPWLSAADTPPLPKAEVQKTKISGLIDEPSGKERKIRRAWMRPTSEAELSLDKDKLEFTIDGRKVELDLLTRRHVVKHLQYALQIAGQKGSQQIEQDQLMEQSKRVLERFSQQNVQDQDVKQLLEQSERLVEQSKQMLEQSKQILEQSGQ